MRVQLPMDPLSGLRDIHLPPLPPWWPPAPGWWVVALLGLVALGYAVHTALRLWRRTRGRRAAVRTLAELRRRYQRGESAEILTAELSTLLRRAAMSRHPREQVAGLTGRDWLAFLDDDQRRFSDGVGRCLATAPYARKADVDLEALLSLCEQWLRRNA